MVGRVRPCGFCGAGDPLARGYFSRFTSTPTLDCPPCTILASTNLPICCSTTVAASKRAKRCSSRRSTCRTPTLVCRLVEGAAERGAVPLVSWKSNAVLRSLYQTATEESMKLAGKFESARMEQVQAYIGIRGAANSSQFADVPHEKMDLYQQHWWKAVHTDVRIAKTKWVVLRYPTDSFAQAANMSTPAFEDFYFDVCTADYAAMAEAQKPLVDADGSGRPRADRRARHGAGVFDQGHPGDPLLGRAQHSGRRSLHRPGPRQHQRPHSLQHAVALPGHGVRQHRVRIQERQDRRARRPTKRRRSTRFSTPTKAPATAANGRSASTTACGTRCSTRCSTKRSAAHST